MEFLVEPSSASITVMSCTCQTGCYQATYAGVCEQCYGVYVPVCVTECTGLCVLLGCGSGGRISPYEKEQQMGV